MRDHTILSLKRLHEKGPVTRLIYEKRRDASLKKKKSFKSKVKKIDELTTQIQEISEEVRDLLFEVLDRDMPSGPFYHMEGCVRKMKESFVEMYEFAHDSYRDKYHGDDAFSNSESDASAEWMEDYTPSELK